MLGEEIVYATLAVKNMEAARKFYEQKLDLKPAGTEGSGFVAYYAGESMIFVYKSQYAGTNQATAVTWIVEDVEQVVEDLKKRGVSFERYDLPGMIRKGDVLVGGKRKLAWFKDPDGNIHGITNG